MVLENTRLCTNIAPKFQIPEKLREPVLNWHTGTAHKKHQSTLGSFIVVHVPQSGRVAIVHFITRWWLFICVLVTDVERKLKVTDVETEKKNIEKNVNIFGCSFKFQFWLIDIIQRSINQGLVTHMRFIYRWGDSKIHTPRLMCGQIAIRFIYSESAAQDEQNEHQHHSLPSTFTFLVGNMAIFASESPFCREILHEGRRIRKRRTYSESASQGEQNEHQHHSLP